MVVPAAEPPSPVDVDQVTCATPLLDCAVPLMVMVLAGVATVVIAGDRMVRDGAAELVPGPGLDGVVGLSTGPSWSTAKLWETSSWAESTAVTVIRLAPGISGMDAMVQFVAPSAIPVSPRFDQLTWTDPDPPDVVPLKAIEDAPVIPGGG